MRGILEFELPKENSEFMLAKRGSEWANILYTIDRQLRDWVKYGEHPFKDKDAREILDSIRDLLFDTMQDSNLTFGDLN